MARYILVTPVPAECGAPDCARILDGIFGGAQVPYAELPTVISRPMRSSAYSEFLALEFTSADALRGAWYRLRATFDGTAGVNTRMPDCLVRHASVEWLFSVADALPGEPSTGWDHGFLHPVSTFTELRRAKFLTECKKLAHERDRLKKMEDEQREERDREIRETRAMAREEEEQRQLMFLTSKNVRGEARMYQWGQHFSLSCSAEHLPAAQQALEAAWEEQESWSPAAWADRLKELRRTAVELWGNEGHGGWRRGVSRSQETPAERTLRLREEKRARRAKEADSKTERLQEERLAGVRCACVGCFPYGGKRRRLSVKTPITWCNEHREGVPCTRLASSSAALLWPHVERFQGLWLCKRCAAAYRKRGATGKEDGLTQPKVWAENDRGNGANGPE